MNSPSEIPAMMINSVEDLGGGNIRIYVQIAGRTFKRVFHWAHPPVWAENDLILEKKETDDLENIFKALHPALYQNPQKAIS